MSFIVFNVSSGNNSNRLCNSHIFSLSLFPSYNYIQGLIGQNLARLIEVIEEKRSDFFLNVGCILMLHEMYSAEVEFQCTRFHLVK